MKETIFDYNENTDRKNITYHFQPNQFESAIKQAIIKRCKQKRPSIPARQLHEHHIGGLPSPPVEEKKISCISSQEEQEACIKQEPMFSPPPASPAAPSLSAQEIRDKIEALKQEKHRLFQLIKQLMLREEQEKRKQRIEQAQAKIRAEAAIAQQEIQNKKRLTKKKSRWAPVSTIPPSPLLSSPPQLSHDSPFHSNYYARSPVLSSRYNSYARPRQSMSRPTPYSR
ncbi:hypothetical protein BD560DRAFT_443122 [Blakeslea trispora]|nr:hypothetical protein BD560DRAFT_443122 [Blakeslea trispora]